MRRHAESAEVERGGAAAWRLARRRGAPGVCRTGSWARRAWGNGTRRHLFAGRGAVLTAALLLATAALSGATAVPARATEAPAGTGASTGKGTTVWLCRPGAAGDPCEYSTTATVVRASGATSTSRAHPGASAGRFDCFYVYPTVSLEGSANSDLRVQKSEVDVAIAQASRFSQVCRVWAPMYRQVTVHGLAQSDNLAVAASAGRTAYRSIRAGFEDYIAHVNRGRPIVFIGHSQGAAMLILLLSHLVDNDPALRGRLVLAVILGGNVEVRTRGDDGGSFSHIPTCSSTGEAGCVIAYSSFPGRPPASSLFGRPGQGVSLQSGQFSKAGLQVACVNPAAIGGGSGPLDPYFPSQGKAGTPWVEYPGLYRATCEHGGGASWLEVAKATGSSDRRPVVREQDGPDWGFHADDVNLALGNLVSDVSAAEASWSKAHA
ncbi:MAG: DUF3089 domain-containing protein [Acidimicrobiales bacterium]